MRQPELPDPSCSDESRRLYQHDIEEMWDPEAAPHVWNQYHSQLETYLAFAPEDRHLRILDVGCAQGTLALLLAERENRVVAVDLRQHFLDYAVSRHERGDIRFVCGDVLNMDAPGEFDLIFCNQLVEHLVFPEALIRKLIGWLAPGGRLVVTTPNGSYMRNGLPSFGTIGNPMESVHRQCSADGDGHFFAYRDFELREIAKSAGLRDLEVRFFETPWISGHVKFRYLHGRVPLAVLRMMDRLTLSIPLVGRFAAHQMLVTGIR